LHNPEAITAPFGSISMSATSSSTRSAAAMATERDQASPSQQPPHDRLRTADTHVPRAWSKMTAAKQSEWRNAPQVSIHVQARARNRLPSVSCASDRLLRERFPSRTVTAWRRA
jgi:hypothetical protein